MVILRALTPCISDSQFCDDNTVLLSNIVCLAISKNSRRSNYYANIFNVSRDTSKKLRGAV